MIELLVPLAAQVAVLGAQPLMVERAADHHQQLVDFERLLQVIQRSQLHRFEGALDGGVGRHHQHLRALAFRRGGDVVADQIEPAQLGHDVVHDAHVERPFAQEALSLAMNAEALTDGSRPEFLDVLGMAFAETGDFTNAVKAVEAALNLGERGIKGLGLIH